jgi:hypothetical protein
VRDTGIGMTPVQLATLFQAFQQPTHRRREYGGTGLGLRSPSGWSSGAARSASRACRERGALLVHRPAGSPARRGGRRGRGDARHAGQRIDPR